MQKQMTLGIDFDNIEIKRIEFIKTLSNEHELVISYPSFTRKGLNHYCHYMLNNSRDDYCSDESGLYNRKCWHIRFKPLVLMLFLNRKPGKDFMEMFEVYGAYELNQVCWYIISQLRNGKERISALDLNNLPITKPTRRIIGSAFLKLKRQGIITEAGYAHGDSKKNAMNMNQWKLTRDPPDFQPAIMGVKV